MVQFLNDGLTWATEGSLCQPDTVHGAVRIQDPGAEVTDDFLVDRFARLH